MALLSAQGTRKAAVTAATFGAISLIVAFIYAYQLPPSAYGLTIGLQHGPAQGPKHPEICNPLLRRGYISSHNATWTPIISQEGCPPIANSELKSLLPDLKNKTFYFYGDSVMRNAAADFCEQIGAPIDRLPDPPGYLTTSDRQAIHSCHLPEQSFTAVNIYTFGMKEWDATDEPFLTAHNSINHRPEDDPSIWGFEDRMKTPHTELVRKFGSADVVILGTGLWDLPYLQRYITREFEERNITQTEAPPAEFLMYYARRIREYLELAEQLHRPTLKGIYMATLHDPRKFDMKPEFGMEGFSSENVQFSCLAEPRVRGLREVQIAVAETVDGVTVLPYDRWIRAAPPDHRMRDDIHPSAFVNEFFSMAAAWSAKSIAE